MNNNAKCRAWHKTQKRMFQVGAMKWNEKGEITHVFQLDGLCFSAEDVELMWWTGLTDTQGKNIYERDIVQAPWDEKYTCKGVVEFSEAWFGVNLEAGEEWPEHVTFLETGSFEVIGNIREHPHLMETNQQNHEGN